jgi:Asp-tRNA(Asn)/Glu-tRNA(Gln) amidotransferase A subunit family amidase
MQEGLDDVCILGRPLLHARHQACRGHTGQEDFPVGVVGTFAKPIEAVNPKLNAYCTLNLKGARATADVGKQAVAHNADLGPLHGVPVAVKDSRD